MGPPVARVPWSPDFVAQTLEILPVYAVEQELFWLKPVHAQSLRIGLPVSAAPADFVVEALAWYPLRARVVHSTSWRHEDRRVVLTYLVVIDRPQALPSDSLVAVPVERSELARGSPTDAPREIGVSAVLEHALRHLAWLLRDDAAIADALPGWQRLVADYTPEPFRPLG
jgi:hypothetical protein